MQYWKPVLVVFLFAVGLFQVRNYFSNPTPRPWKKMVWVYDLPGAIAQAGGSEKAFATYAKNHGVTEVVVKAVGNQGGVHSRNERYLKNVFQACKEQGINVFPYALCQANYSTAQMAGIRKVMRIPGASGIVLDIESAWPKESLKGFLKLVREERDKIDAKGLIGVAAHAKLLRHSEIDYRTIENDVDFWMPMAYFSSFKETPLETLSEMDKDWAWARGKLVPIVQAYDKGHGLKYIKPSDLRTFLSLSGKYQGVCLFRWSLMGKEHWQVFKDSQAGLAWEGSEEPENTTQKTRPREKKDPNEIKIPADSIPATLEPENSGTLSGWTIVLDPGHGGTDPGCGWVEDFGSGPNYFYEAAYTYPATYELGQMIRREGGRAIFTATSGAMISPPHHEASKPLPIPRDAIFRQEPAEGSAVIGPKVGITNRVKITKQAVKDYGPKTIFIALHVDSAVRGKKGAHVCVPPHIVQVKKPYLAHFVADSLVESGYRTNRGHMVSYRNNVGVLGANNPIRHKILVEMASAGAAHDSWMVRDRTTRMKECEYILRGVKRFILSPHTN